MNMPGDNIINNVQSTSKIRTRRILDSIDGKFFETTPTTSMAGLLSQMPVRLADPTCGFYIQTILIPELLQFPVHNMPIITDADLFIRNTYPDIPPPDHMMSTRKNNQVSNANQTILGTKLAHSCPH